MPIVYVSLVSKRKISISDMEKKDKKLVVNQRDFKSIGNWLAKNPNWEFMCSSSVNHPGEYGFDHDFNVDEVLSQAIEYAYLKLAVRVPPCPLTEAPQKIEAAVKKYKHSGTVPLLLLRSGKGKEDVLLALKPSELELFIMGIKYAGNLAEIEHAKVAALLQGLGGHRESRSTPNRSKRSA